MGWKKPRERGLAGSGRKFNEWAAKRDEQRKRADAAERKAGSGSTTGLLDAIQDAKAWEFGEPCPYCEGKGMNLLKRRKFSVGVTCRTCDAFVCDVTLRQVQARYGKDLAAGVQAGCTVPV